MRPWVFVGPALLFLFIFIVGAAAADHLPQLPQRASRRERLHARQLHQHACTDDDRASTSTTGPSIFTSWLFIFASSSLILAIVFGRR